MLFVSKYLKLTVNMPGEARLLRFNNGRYETTDPAEIAVLKKAKGVRCMVAETPAAPATTEIPDIQDSKPRGSGRPARG